MGRKLASSLSIFVTALVLVFVLGCSKKSDDPAPPNAGTVTPQSNDSYDPDKRWPEIGDFSFEFQEQRTGLNCSTGKLSFSKKSEFCMALQNRKLVNGCAIEARRQMYREQCGSDFKEMQLFALVYRGYDPRLGRSCETKSLSSAVDLENLCEYLQNEIVHQSCHWDARKYEFQWLGCRGIFADLPETEDSNVPDPISGTPGAPATPGIEELEVQKDLRFQTLKESFSKQGINLDEASEQRCRLGLPEARRALYVKKVLQYLDLIDGQRDMIVSSKDLVTTLSVGCWEVYDSDNKVLEVDVEQDSDHLIGLYSAIRTLKNFEQTHKVKLEIETKSNVILAYVNFLNQRSEQIKSLNSLVKQIGFNASGTSLNLEYGLIKLQLDNILAEFDRLNAGLNDIAQFARFAQRAGIQFVLKFSETENQALRTLRSLGQTLNSEQKTIQYLLNKGLLRSIYIQPAGAGVEVGASGRTISITFSPQSAQQFLQFLRSLEKAEKLEQQLGVKIVYKSNQYTGRFESFLDLLEQNKNAIVAKKNSITEIWMSSMKTSYDSTGKSLAIFYNDDASAVRKTIQQIK